MLRAATNQDMDETARDEKTAARAIAFRRVSRFSQA
jgi:hypothetical protein